MKKLKIALIGYGRMGHAVEKIAVERGHEIVCRIDAGNEDLFLSEEFRSADVAVEFSIPDAAVNNYMQAFKVGVPVVAGTTGWLARLEEVRKECDAKGAAFLYSSNFSPGVNIFRSITRFASKLFDNFDQYSPSMQEVHHIHKLDHPSGTAISIAGDIIDHSGRLERWEETQDNASEGDGILPIKCVREGEVPGTHTVIWTSSDDQITLEHKAFRRDGFARGAVMAAEWLAGKKGFFTMADMLNETTGLKDIFE